MNVRTTEQAAEDIRSIDEWWRAHRRASPALFSDELSATFELLSVFPRAGSAYRKWRDQDVRRVVLRATRHHVYYRIYDAGVLVMAVWSAVRGRGPNFRDRA